MKKKQKHTIQFVEEDIHISDEQIDKHKNFNRLMQDYQVATRPLYKTPLYKNKKVFLAVLLILVILFLVIESMEKKEKEITPVPSEQSENKSVSQKG